MSDASVRRPPSSDTTVAAPPPPSLEGQLSKIAVDTRGAVKVEVSFPLHQVLPLAGPLMLAYGGNVRMTL